MQRNDATKIRTSLGQRIAALRAADGLTQEQFAENLGTSTRYLQAVESGRENLTIESLAKLANALGRPLLIALR